METHTNWANIGPTYAGVSDDETGLNRFLVPEPTPFNDRFPLAKKALVLTQAQRAAYESQLNLPSVGPNEFDLALSRIECDARNVGRKLSEIIEAWRAETCKGPSLRPEVEWKQARIHSDELAARELLKGSKTLADSDALTEKARLAQEQADTTRQAIEKLWFEYSGIPRQCEQLNFRLQAIANERANLDVPALEANYENLYSARFDGRELRGGDLDQIHLQISQAERKTAILDKVEPVVHAALKALRARDKQIARELDVAPHQIVNS